MNRNISISFIFIILESFLIFASSAFELNSFERWSEPVNLLELNTKENDFAPSWNLYEGVLYFNSEVKGYSHFYTSERIDTFKFTPAKFVAGGLNDTRSNRSYITFVSRNEALISGYNLYERRSYLNIFKSIKTKNAWGFPSLEDSLIFECFNSHPTVSPDGSIMVFSSDRFSEYGDTDLWMAVRQDNGGWGAIVNLSEINSPGNEITPYLVSADTLFFATDGQFGPGGYDIYFSVRIDGVWQRPKQLIGINSEFDESDPMILPSKEIIFASNRPNGKGKLDLYISRPTNGKIISSSKTDRKLGIDTYISSMNIKIERSYDYVSPIPYIIAESKSPLSARKIGSAIGGLEKSELLNADSLYAASVSIIANRLKKTEGSRLNIGYRNFIEQLNIKSKNIREGSFEFINYEPEMILPGEFMRIINTPKDLKQYISEAYGIAKEFIDVSDEGADDELLMLYSDQHSIFSPYYIDWSEINIEPPTLELIIDGEDFEISTCDCGSIFGNDTLVVHSGIKKISQNIQIDTRLFHKNVINYDDFEVFVRCNYKDNSVQTATRIIQLIKSKIEGRKHYEISGKFYERYLFFITNPEDIINDFVYGSVFDELINNAHSSGRIIVQYFNNDSEQSRINSDAVSNHIKNSLKKNIPIVQSFKKSSDILTFSQEIAPYLIQVLLEM